jgi:hypothetical protein
MAKPLVSDELWETIAPLLPPKPAHPKGGRPFTAPDRAALAGNSQASVFRSGGLRLGGEHQRGYAAGRIGAGQRQLRQRPDHLRGIREHHRHQRRRGHGTRRARPRRQPRRRLDLVPVDRSGRLHLRHHHDVWQQRRHPARRLPGQQQQRRHPRRRALERQCRVPPKPSPGAYRARAASASCRRSSAPASSPSGRRHSRGGGGQGGRDGPDRRPATAARRAPARLRRGRGRTARGAIDSRRRRANAGAAGHVRGARRATAGGGVWIGGYRGARRPSRPRSSSSSRASRPSSF